MNRAIATVHESDTINNTAKNDSSGLRSSSTFLSSSRSLLAAGTHSISNITKPIIQAKLRIGAPNDKYEQEADRVADQVMRMPEPGFSSASDATPPANNSNIRGGMIQRTCASCTKEYQAAEQDERPVISGNLCPKCRVQTKPVLKTRTPIVQRQELEEEEEEETLQAKSAGQVPAMTPDTAAGIQSIKGGGQPLSEASRSYFEPRFSHDFSQVRIHADNRAAGLANSINARAFTLGRDVVFGADQYRPHSNEGRRLMAHELTHVVQQGHAKSASSSHHSITPQTSTTNNTIRRADPDTVGRTMALGITLGTGIQFFPTNVTDTRVGPVGIAGGLRNQRASRLNVIIGEHLTPRMLARLILPLWTTATPFTAPGAAAPVPLDIIDEEILAKGLMVYNRGFLGLPSMDKWRAGLRFPLPVVIDEATGVATLHPGIIRSLSAGFEAAWLPLLDSPATAVAAVPAATLTADVTAFLARETTASGRGIHLSSRAKTNAVAALPFIQETFRQLGAAGFDVALGFMYWMVNRGMSLLAAQRDGAAILAEIQTALAAAPAVLTAEQQSELDRANLMMGLVAAVAAQPPPGARRTRPEKTVVVDTLKLVDSTHNPATQIAIANGIFSQCNVRIQHGVDEDDSQAAAPFTTTWLGGDTDLRTGTSCGSVTADERRMFNGGVAQYGMGAGDIGAYFVATVTGLAGGGYSCPGTAGVHALLRHNSVVNNSGDPDTLAHELGHQLINNDLLERHTLPGIMHGRPRATVTLSTAQCNRIYSNA